MKFLGEKLVHYVWSCLLVTLFCVMRVVTGDTLDRKSVVSGKSVDLGGRRIIKKKK